MSDAWVDEFVSTEALELARQREATHGGYAGRIAEPSRSLELNAIGAAGEVAFAHAFGLTLGKVNADGAGDGGVDFVVPMPSGRCLKIDVKTALKWPPYLLVAKHTVTRDSADVYVLARHDHGLVTFVGWETKGIMLQMPLADFGGVGVQSYFRPREQLRPMGQLVDLLALRVIP